jgi:RNA polymerase sigma-70 factor (ECF subfamily)
LPDVGRLANLYRASAIRDAADLDEPGLEETLAALCARGRGAHPDLVLSEETFVAHLARCGAPLADGGPVEAGDLYLACACLEGQAAAVARLRELGRSAVARYLGRIGGASEIREEIEQRLWDGVLVGAPRGPKLATYSGRGALSSWIGVSAQRIALMELRHERAETRARQEAAARGRLANDDPELAAIKERFRERFQGAVAAALGTLEDREKTLYRMHLVDGQTLESIGKVYNVHHTTVLRWLAAARERVVEEAKRRLRAELDVSTSEFESLARLLASEVDLNASVVLGNQGAVD